MKTVVAIDGPAASGKSSAAREVSLRLGYSYVDSGAFYRAITWWILRRNADPTSVDQVTALVAESPLASGFENNEAFLRIAGVNATPHLRDDDVNRSVSPVSLVPAVRERLTNHLRELACQRDVVVEGRDIGSMVYPDTPYKFYIDASQEVRQRRRNAEGQDDEIAVRDRIDSSRPNAPLTIARGALFIDSTNLTVDRVVDEIIRHLKEKGLPSLQR
ncbi:MAG TPA: (d)CMP kinase [Terrimicrobiaceae bacterium]